MKASRKLVATFLAFGIAVVTVGTAVAQSTQGDADETGPGMMQGHHGRMGQVGPGMMQGGMMQGGMGTAAAPFGTRVTPMMNLSVEDVRSYLEEFAERATADELITAHHAPDADARLRSVDLLAEAMLQPSHSR